jgi:geranylgeranyl transferase type-1 subunit beta
LLLPTAMSTKQPIHFEKHKKYLLHSLSGLPQAYSSQDPNRITLAYFIISGLDILQALQTIDKQKVIDWIYSLQVLPDKDNPEKNIRMCGFRGGSFFGMPFDPSGQPVSGLSVHDQGHIAMTYVALNMLLILGDDFKRLNRTAILTALKHLQQPDGSFVSVYGGNESDMRFVYCACAISYMLNDWQAVDRVKVEGYILKSQAYDGGFGQGPLQESHGGSTYCAVASLWLLGRLETVLSGERRARLVRWLVERQLGGFQGRINKPPDACYTWWVGATLVLLGHYDLVEYEHLTNFVASCQHAQWGGIAKVPDTYPDVMHTYLALAGLSFAYNTTPTSSSSPLLPVDPALNLSRLVAQRLASFHVPHTPPQNF